MRDWSVADDVATIQSDPAITGMNVAGGRVPAGGHNCVCTAIQSLSETPPVGLTLTCTGPPSRVHVPPSAAAPAQEVGVYCVHWTPAKARSSTSWRALA